MRTVLRRLPTILALLFLAFTLALPVTSAFAAGDSDGQSALDLDPTIVILVGAIMPVFMSIINGVNWSSAFKALAGLLVIGLAGVLVAWLTDHWTRMGVLETVVAVYTFAQISYHAVFKPTGADESIERNIWPKG